MESSCPSMMLVCAGGSKGNGGIQCREFPLKVHDQWATEQSRESAQYFMAAPNACSWAGTDTWSIDDLAKLDVLFAVRRILADMYNLV